MKTNMVLSNKKYDPRIVFFVYLSLYSNIWAACLRPSMIFRL